MTARLELPAAFEAAVGTHARHFDLVALVRLLEAHGYAPERTFFESNAELASATSLVESVRFWDGDETSFGEVGAERAASAYVTVTVNLGLLGGQGLLPTYFHTALEQSPRPERMLAFLRFFDQRLLAGLVRAACPERDPALFPDLSGTRRALFQLLGVHSVSTLHWLFQSVFPELGVHLVRHALAHDDAAFGARTGMSTLDGTAVVGKVYETRTAGFLVRLFAEHEHHDHGERWFDIAGQRLRDILLPLLQPFRFALRIELDVAHRTAAVVEPETLAWYEEESSLGYQRVLGRLPDGVAWPARDAPTRARARRWEDQLGTRHVVELFRGNVGDTARSEGHLDREDTGVTQARLCLLQKVKHRHLEQDGT
jgi:predicted component of type VI protein secretion system